MDPQSLSLILVGCTFLVGLIVGMPIAFVLIVASSVGFFVLRGPNVMLAALTAMPFSKASDIGLVVIPLFVLMGHLAERAGVSEKAFQVAYRFVGHLRGGLGITTVFACAAFAATSGSSVATSATVGKIAFREMKKFNYDDAISAGTVASAGLLGIMIPPSIMMVVYGLITQVDIGKMFVAGVIPGILTAFIFSLGLYVLATVKPHLMPVSAARVPWKDRLVGLKDAWEIIILFGVLIGGIYTGLFTATEAASAGVLTAFVLLVLKHGWAWREILRGAKDASRTCAMIFLILIGAGLFSQYIGLSGAATGVVGWMTSLDVNRYVLLGMILLLYVPLGMFLEPISICLITLPVIFPVIVAKGFDPIWFGILIVKMSELANITPPIGVNVFVIRSVNPSIPLHKVFSGAFMFMVLEVITLVILVTFPSLSLFLVRLMPA